jgi:hypothetical protein
VPAQSDTMGRRVCHRSVACSSRCPSMAGLPGCPQSVTSKPRPLFLRLCAYHVDPAGPWARPVPRPPLCRVPRRRCVPGRAPLLSDGQGGIVSGTCSCKVLQPGAHLAYHGNAVGNTIRCTLTRWALRVRAARPVHVTCPGQKRRCPENGQAGQERQDML